MTMKKILKITKIILISYLFYFLATFIFIFKIPITGKTNLNYNIEDMKINTGEETYAKIFEDTKEALDIRLNMISNANKSIDLSYLRIEIGEVGELLIGSLLTKADQGIKIRILVDGFMYSTAPSVKTLVSHENVEQYVYEPANFLLPYANNNIIHDKLIIVDQKYGLTGGRNIGERYLNPNNDNITLDRDVLVYSNNTTTESVVQMSEYFDEVVESKYVKKITYKSKPKYNEIKTDLKDKFNEYINNISTFEEQKLNSIKINKATFVRSPLNRFNKEPIVFNVLEELMKEENDIIIQSPYFTPTKVLNKYYYNDVEKNITFITNNTTTNPNLGGVGGYLQIRKRIAKNNVLYEFQDEFAHHGKSLTIGNDISAIGSLNMDHRSIYLSTESMLIIHSEEFNEELKVSFNNIISKSLRVDKKGNYYENNLVTPVKRKKLDSLFKTFVSLIASLFNEMI